MGFLTPAFLAGLAALAVPILVHLTHRARTETVRFPSLMFLEQIPYRSVRRQRLRHWPLFALRALALLLLAVAFARPFFAGAGRAAGPAAGATVRIVLLDRSYSMGYGDAWARARAAARRAITQSAPEDQVGLVLFDRAAASSGPPSGDRTHLLADLAAAAQPGFAVTRYAPALRLAREMIESSGLPRSEVVLVTDFQKTGWEGGDDVRLPAATTLVRVDVSDRDPSNVAITGVDLQRDYEAGRERVIASARLVNKGTRRADDLPVSLEVDGRVLRQARASLGPNASATIAFEPFPLPPNLARAIVRVASDALPADDAFHVVLEPGGDVPVVLLEDATTRGRSLYLQRALAIGHRPRFRVEAKDAASLRPEDLVPGALVVLDETSPPGGAVARRLQEFVEAGGGVLVVLGDAATATRWPAEASFLLPGAVGPAVDRSSEWGATLSYVDYAHPIFAMFRGPHSGDFSSARFLRYRRLEARTGVLARFDDGAVALAAHTVGKGRVLVWTSGMDTTSNDLPLQAVFLPFLHQVVRYAAGYVESPPSRTVGDALDLGTALAGKGTPVAILAPSGERSALAAPARGVDLREPGFYEARPAAGGAPLAVIAVNVDAAESDLARVDPEELAASVTRAGITTERRPPASLSAGEEEDRQAGWRYLLGAALLMLAAETVLSNRLSARPSPVRVP